MEFFMCFYVSIALMPPVLDRVNKIDHELLTPVHLPPHCLDFTFFLVGKKELYLSFQKLPEIFLNDQQEPFRCDFKRMCRYRVVRLTGYIKIWLREAFQLKKYAQI